MDQILFVIEKKTETQLVLPTKIDFHDTSYIYSEMNILLSKTTYIQS